MHRRMWIGLLFLGGWLDVASALASPPLSIQHTPPAISNPHIDMNVHINVANAWAGEVAFRYRQQCSTQCPPYREIAFNRAQGTIYQITIPGTDMVPPGIEYYIVGKRDGREYQYFASREHPHAIIIHEQPDILRRMRSLSAHDHKLGRVISSVEFVNFGTRIVALSSGETARVRDSYFRLEASIRYLLFQYFNKSPVGIEALSFGITRLEGETLINKCKVSVLFSECTQYANLPLSGWGQMGWSAGSGIEGDVRLMVSADSSKIGIGGMVEVRLGTATGNHLAVGGEYLGSIGTTGHMRLGWATVPRFPMAATVAVTELPSSRQMAAVRLIYDISTRIPRLFGPVGLQIGTRISYQARDHTVGSFGAGLTLTFEFQDKEQKHASKLNHQAFPVCVDRDGQQSCTR